MKRHSDIENLLSAHKPEQALGLIEKLCAKEPENAGLHFARARALYQLGRLDEALGELTLVTSRRKIDRATSIKAKLLAALCRANTALDVGRPLRNVLGLRTKCARNPSLRAECDRTALKLVSLGVALGLMSKSAATKSAKQVYRAFDESTLPHDAPVECLAVLENILGKEFSVSSRSILEQRVLTAHGIERARSLIKLSRLLIASDMSDDDRPIVCRRALTMLEEAEAIFIGEGCPLGLAEVSLTRGLTEVKMGRNARDHLSRALKESEELGFLAGMYEASSALAEVYANSGKSSESFHYRHTALQTAQRMGFIAGTAFSRLALATIAQHRELLQVAWDHYRELIELARYDSVCCLIGAAIAQGIAALPGQLKTAIELSRRAVTLQQKAQRSVEMRLSQAILGVLLMQDHQWDEAAATWRSLSRAHRKLGDPSSALEHLAFEAQSFFMKNAEPETPAEEARMEATRKLNAILNKLAALPEGRARLATASVLQVEGQIHIAVDDPLKAIRSFGAAQKIYQDLSLPVQAAHTGTLLGLAYQMLAKHGVVEAFNEATWHLDEAASLFDKAGMSSLAKHARQLAGKAKPQEITKSKSSASAIRAVMH